MTFVFFWVGFSVVVGMLASSKGRSGAGWGFISIVISPLLAGLIVLVLSDLKEQEAVSQREARDRYDAKLQAEQTKTCPKCAETVKKAALVCRFCGNGFDTQAPSKDTVATDSDGVQIFTHSPVHKIGKA